MTDAHAKAVEAAADIAAQWFDYEHKLFPGADTVIADAITAYLAAMRAEGWVMVRDDALQVGAWTEEERDGMAAAYKAASMKHGHYETLFAVGAWLLRHRAAMLKGAGDEQG